MALPASSPCAYGQPQIDSASPYDDATVTETWRARIEGPGSTWPRFVGVRHPKRCRRPQVGGGHHCGASVGRVIAGPGPRGERHPPRRRRARPERPRGGPIGPAVADRPRGGPIGPAVADRVERPDGPTQPPIHGRAIALDVDRAEHRSDAGPGRGSERGSDSCPDVSSPGPDHRPQARRDRGRRPADGELADVRQPRRDDDERLRQQREVLSARGLDAWLPISVGFAAGSKTDGLVGAVPVVSSDRAPATVSLFNLTARDFVTVGTKGKSVGFALPPIWQRQRSRRRRSSTASRPTTAMSSRAPTCGSSPGRPAPRRSSSSTACRPTRAGRSGSTRPDLPWSPGQRLDQPRR